MVEFDVGDLCHFTYTDGLAYKAEVLAIIDDTNIKIKVVNGPSLTLKKEFAMKPNTLAKTIPWRRISSESDSSSSQQQLLPSKKRKVLSPTSFDGLTGKSKITVKCLIESLKNMSHQNQQKLQHMVLEAIVKVEKQIEEIDPTAPNQTSSD